MADELAPAADAPAPATDAPAPAFDPAAPIDPGEFYRDDKPAEPASADAPEGEADAPAEADPAAPADPEPIAPPTSWAKDAKDLFAGLPREAQEVIATRERDRETFLQAKSREAANARSQVETEAHGVVQRLMENHARQLETYAQQFNVAQPDTRLLATGNPQDRELFYQQDAQYRYATAQRDALSQQVEQARQQASFAEQQQAQAALQREHEMLTEKLPGWADPSERAKLLSDLQPIAAELGYPPEVIKEARAADFLALKQAFDWRQKAFKYDELMKQRMVPVRAAKTIPPVQRTGVPAGQTQPVNDLALLYPNDVRRS